MILRARYLPFFLLAAGPALAQTTTRVSVGPAGLQSDGPCLGPSMVSLDGRFVTFTGNATNLVPGDTNHHADAFVHDLSTGVTSCVSVSSAGIIGNLSSGDPRISGDGRLVVYVSTATNLVPGDTNGRDDVFVHDRATGTTTRVNLGGGGVQANDHSVFAAIAAGGRYVSYVSSATNIVGGDTNGFDDVFLHDLQSGTTVRATQGLALAQPNASCMGQSLSADGHRVAYWSAASNLVAGDTNGVEDAFVYDLLTGVTTRVSVDSAGVQGNNKSGHPSLSPDGRWVAFWSNASNLVLGDTNATGDVFLHDMQTGATTRVSVSSLGVQGNGNSSAFRQPACSTDGLRVSFTSEATNLVPGDTNGWHDVFVHERASGTTTRVSVSSLGVQSNGQSSPQLPSSISGDGRTVGFDSGASNLVPGDTNGQYDIFVHQDPPTFAAFCAGDGTSGACPCLNNGSAGNGCANSSFASGANLTATGTPSVSADSVILNASQMTGSVALFYQGGSQLPPAVIDDGLGCVGGPIIRLGAKAAAGTSSFPQAGDPSVSVRGSIPPAGGTFYYQCIYRNAAAAFCPIATTNRTNGVKITWAP
jgi:Tol biopolymer transport system component